MAGFMTFPVLTRVAGTRAGPIPRVKYGSGVKTGPASRLVGWANIQPAAAPAPGTWTSRGQAGWNLCPEIDVS